jgi:flagellar hook assembly protein FlgD
MNGEYAIQIEATDTSDNSSYLDPQKPVQFRMDEEVRVKDIMNAPNPFSRTTFFSYSLTQPADKIVIKIYTLRGKLVRTLEQDLPKWQYNEEFWDGRDEDGNRLGSGVYLYKFILTDSGKKIERIGKLAIVR